MKSYERVMRAVGLSEADRVPVVPQVTYATAKVAKISFTDGARDAGKMADALLKGWRKLRYDGIYVGWEPSFNLVAEAMGCTLTSPERGTPSVSKPIIENTEDLRRITVPDPNRDGRLPLHLNAIRLVRSMAGRDVPLFSYIPGPLTLAGLLRGTKKLLVELVTKKGSIHDILELTTAASIEFGLAKLDAGIDVAVVADPTSSSSMVSPKIFDEFSLPHIEQITSKIKRRGIPSLHICGRTAPILEGMARTGAKILELDSQVDLAQAKRTVGSSVCLQGNVDTGKLLMGEPQTILEESHRCIESCARGGGFILSSGCEVPIDTPQENISAMVEAAERFGSYS